MTTPLSECSETEKAGARTCLEKILSSSVFARSKRQQRFLRYVVAHSLAGNTARLKGYTIGVEVFDRGPTFEPMLDAIVRVEAARLRAKLREYYDSEGRGDPVRFDLPKGAYTVRAKLREPRSPPLSPPMEEPHDAPTVAPAAEAHPGSAALPRQLPITDKPSLAVLPFANLSEDPQRGYFADGITDDLITELSRLSGLFVISRRSSFAYRGLSKRMEEIGAELGVRYLLEGSVQRAQERVRITAKLIDAASGAHLWAERYDRDLKDIFAVQDDVTRRIIAVLQVRLAGAEAERFGHEGTASIEAHDALLRGLERFWLYTQKAAEEARAWFAKAVEHDRGYAAAHAWLARALAYQWIMLWSSDPATLEQAFEHARTAVRLDDRLPFAHSALGWVQLWRKEKEASIGEGWRAVALDPNNAEAHVLLSVTLSAAGRAEEALHYVGKAIRLNPRPSAFYQFTLGLCHYVLEEYDRAIAALKRSAELAEAFIPAHLLLCGIYTLLERDEEARGERETLLALSGGRKPAVRSIWLDEELELRYQGLLQLAGLQ
jgi:adenylate cyclase